MWAVQAYYLMLNGAVAVALFFGVAIAKSGVLSKWVGVDKNMLDHFNIIISSDNNNVTPNVGVDYEPTGDWELMQSMR